MIQATPGSRVLPVAQGTTETGSATPGSIRIAEWDLPSLDLDALVWPALEPTPLFDIGVGEIVDLLAGLSDYLR